MYLELVRLLVDKLQHTILHITNAIPILLEPVYIYVHKYTMHDVSVLHTYVTTCIIIVT